MECPQSLFCLVGRKDFVIKDPFELIVKKIGNPVCVFLLSNAALAAVAGNILTAAGKFVNGKATVVGTALAFSHAGFKLQIYNVIKGKHGSFVAFRKPLPGNKGGAKGAHDACNVRTDRLASGNFSKLRRTASL